MGGYMNIRYMGDMALCNQKECLRHATCWRFQSLKRLADDQDKDVRKPGRITMFRPDVETCEHYIEDGYYEDPSRHND